MKQIKIISLLAVVIILVTSQSCQKGFLEGVNENPNSPTEVTARVILPGAQGSLAYTQGGDVERYSAIMSQYIIGAYRQFGGYQQYIFTEEDFNNLWNNMYAATMVNFDAIMDIEAANPGAYTAYDGIARILMAYSLAMTTDMFGDIPYEEAFQGFTNLTPAYNTQEEIYEIIQVHLLDHAIEELSNDPGDDFDYPDANDFVYSGDLSAWIGLAHALKARYYMHTVNRDPGAAQKALDEINAGGAITDAGFPFNSGAQSPWFQYIDQRDDIVYSSQGAISCYGDYSISDPAALAKVIERNDPRYPVYIDVTGDYGHWCDGYLGPFFQADNASVWFMKDFERHFIAAEAHLRLGDGMAQQALIDAVNASFVFYGIDPASPEATAYVAAYTTLTGDFNTDLNTIMTEKWLANWLSFESWVDIRRTGYPVLAPNSGSELPRRFIYPTNERLYNPNIPTTNSDLFNPTLWWDN